MSARRAVLGLGAAFVVVACSTPANNSSGSTDTGGLKVAEVVQPQAAKAAMTDAFKGTNRHVDPASRAAVKGKHIVVISGGDAIQSNKVPSDGAQAAATAIGWTVDRYDAGLDKSKYPTLIRQAIAAGVDGIILDAMDCKDAKQALQEAKDQKVVVTGMYSFDCNDPSPGSGDPAGLFSAAPNYGAKAANIDAFTGSYGADQANYIIADSDNKAKIIAIQDSEFTVLYWTLDGFKKTIEASKGSEIVETLDVTVNDILTNQLQTKIQTAVANHPEATWIKSPYSSVTTIGLVPALATKGGTPIKVMGGEGFADELDLVRSDKITAANVISSEWVGWSAVDSMNSVFGNFPQADNGIGWTMVDAKNNLPATGDFKTPVDFQSEYKKAWGVS